MLSRLGLVLLFLTDVGLASRRNLGDHLWRFERSGQDQHDDGAHPHFVCSECGVMTDIENYDGPAPTRVGPGGR